MTAKARAAAHTAYVRQKSENIQAIISEYKTRRKMTFADLAKATGMSQATLECRKGKPGRLRMEDIWMIFEVLDVPDEERKTII